MAGAGVGHDGLEAESLGLLLGRDLGAGLGRPQPLEVGLVLVIARLEYLTDEDNVLGCHVRKHRFVDPRALELGEHFPELLGDRTFAVALELESIKDLLPATRTHDVVDVHGLGIIAK